MQFHQEQHRIQYAKQFSYLGSLAHPKRKAALINPKDEARTVEDLRLMIWSYPLFVIANDECHQMHATVSISCLVDLVRE